MFVIIRVILGVLFIVSGGEKALRPVEDFLSVIDAYKVLPQPLAIAAAWIFPWIEVLTGVFILLGLWLRQALWVLLLISLSLMAMVGQAIVRGLPLDNCGCFGELIHLRLQDVLLVDFSVLVFTTYCLVNIKKTLRWSLDGAYVRP